ncbi:MAG: SGNH/GDSL hydrolase family protein [Planctomycetota bacterium]
MRRHSLLFFPLSLAVFLAGCSGPSPTGPSPLPSVPTLRYSQFLAFGDSLTLGIVPLSSTTLHHQMEHAYPFRLEGLLAARYRTQAFEMVNLGRGGEWAQDGALRLPGALEAERPQVLLLMEGTNDLNALGDAGIRPTVNALESMIRMATAAGVRTLIATIPPERPSPSSASLVSTVPRFNDALRTMAAAQGVPVVEVYEAISADLSFLGADGIHLTPAGYQRVAETFFESIRRNFETPTGLAVQ